jgi:hypothetical protein
MSKSNTTSLFALLASLFLFSAPVHAATTVGVFAGAGLDVADACVSPAGGVCGGIDSDFSIAGAVQALGSITFNPDPGIPGIGSVDFSVALQGPLTQTGSGGGASSIVFNNMVYSFNGALSQSIPFGANYNYFTLGPAAGLINGEYSVDGGTAVPILNLPAQVNGLNCIVDINGAGGCGVTFGANGFTLPVGTETYDFQHTFNVIVPEPASATLLGLSLVSLLVVARRRS